MRVRLVRRPGQHGTRAYVEQYGERLVCVRYRYDAAAGRRYKTIEIIVDEAPWEAKEKRRATPEGYSDQSDVAGAVPATQPSKPQTPESGRSHAFRPGTYVGVRVAWGDFKQVQRLRNAGALWLRNLQVWQLTYKQATDLGFANNIVGTIAELAARR